MTITVLYRLQRPNGVALVLGNAFGRVNKGDQLHSGSEIVEVTGLSFVPSGILPDENTAQGVFVSGDCPFAVGSEVQVVRTHPLNNV